MDVWTEGIFENYNNFPTIIIDINALLRRIQIFEPQPGDMLATYWGFSRIILFLQILKKILHPAHVPYGGMFLEVKNLKNPNPKVVFDPNFFFKSHQFLVLQCICHTLQWLSYTAMAAVSSTDLTITTKWWFLKILFGWKTSFGIRFLEFFTSKNMPPYGTSHGCKIFLDISKSTWYVSLLLQGIELWSPWCQLGMLPTTPSLTASRSQYFEI